MRILPLALLVLALPVATRAQSAPPPPTFDVATIKPSKPDDNWQSWSNDNNLTTVENYTLRALIKIAFDLHSDSQVIGGPEWLNKQHFDIAAKVDEAEEARMKAMKPEDSDHEYQLILRNFLTERFHLKVHPETRPLSAFALLVDGPKSKLTPTPKPADPDHVDHRVSINNTHLEAVGAPMDRLCEVLANMRETDNRVVVNKTNLTGDFNFTLEWTPDRGTPPPADAQFPGLFTALREQLGLKLEHQTIPVPVIVIDSATTPDLD
jgi:uncharacterized protein (TIGR03435 family)